MFILAFQSGQAEAICVVLHTWGSQWSRNTPRGASLSDSVGVRKLVKLLQEGLGCAIEWKGQRGDGQPPFTCLSLNFLISQVGLLNDQQCSGENT